MRQSVLILRCPVLQLRYWSASRKQFATHEACAQRDIPTRKRLQNPLMLHQLAVIATLSSCTKTYVYSLLQYAMRKFGVLPKKGRGGVPLMYHRVLVPFLP